MIIPGVVLGLISAVPYVEWHLEKHVYLLLLLCLSLSFPSCLVLSPPGWRPQGTEVKDTAVGKYREVTVAPEREVTAAANREVMAAFRHIKFT